MPRLEATLGGLLLRLTPKYFPIAHKLALAFTLLASVGMISLGTVVVQGQTQLLKTQMRDFGVMVVRQMAQSSKEQLLADDILGLQVVLNNLVDEGNLLGAAVYSEEGKPVAQAGMVPGDIDLQILAQNTEPHEWSGRNIRGFRVNMASFITPVVFEDVVAGYALLTFNRAFMDSAQSQTIWAVSGATLFLVLLGIGASIVLGQRLTRPIHQIMDASRAITNGNYDVRFQERRNDELGALMISMNTMSEGLLRKEQVEATFSRYVSPKVAKEVLDHLETVELGGRRVEATVLFADIVGFTSMSENMHPEEVSALLNEYFSHIAEAAHALGGHVDKYIGDCAMLVFGVPVPDKDHMFHAVACAVVIQHLVATLNIRRERNGCPPIQFRIGVNSGSMLAGNMGSRERMEYTVVGDAVNLASRLASVAAPGQVVICDDMYRDPRLDSHVEIEKLGDIRIRGKRLPVATYQVTDVTPEHRALVRDTVERILRRKVAA